MRSLPPRALAAIERWCLIEDSAPNRKRLGLDR
jgi:hypothetical protein